MRGIKDCSKKILMCCAVAALACAGTAQDLNGTGMPSDSAAAARLKELRSRKAMSAEKLGMKDRVAFRTNMLGWVLATPNIGVQFDVTPWDYNKWTLGADVKWNPGSNQTFTPSLEYKMLDARLEARRYFRVMPMTKPGKTRIPKFWRAYYWGLYAGYTDYTLYAKSGYTGTHFGAGATAGWEIRLLPLRNGALDLDLGLSAGWIYGESKKRTKEGNGYVFTDVKDWHLTPYPIISEVRVALVYRFKSVKDKYNRSKR